jgi:CspA family cold shock protein
MEGTIKRIKQDKGFGFIRGSNNMDYFFHRSECTNLDFSQVEEGMKVDFDDEPSPKGPRAVNVVFATT